jgi:hypothetical protein
LSFERFIREVHSMVNAHRRHLGLEPWDFGDGTGEVEIEQRHLCQCGCGNFLTPAVLERGWKYCWGHSPKHNRERARKALAAGAD